MPLEGLQAVDLAFRLPVGPALTERSSDGLNVGAKSSGEGRQHAAIRLRQPIRQLLGTPVERVDQDEKPCCLR